MKGDNSVGFTGLIMPAGGFFRDQNGFRWDLGSKLTVLMKGWPEANPSMCYCEQSGRQKEQDS